MHVHLGLLQKNHCWDQGVHTVKVKIARFLVSTSVNSRQYVVMCHTVTGHFGTGAEMSGPKDELSGPMVRTVMALGPKCLGAKVSGYFSTITELS